MELEDENILVLYRNYIRLLHLSPSFSVSVLVLCREFGVVLLPEPRLNHVRARVTTAEKVHERRNEREVALASGG